MTRHAPRHVEPFQPPDPVSPAGGATAVVYRTTVRGVLIGAFLGVCALLCGGVLLPSLATRCGYDRPRAARKDVIGITTGCQMYVETWGAYPPDDVPIAIYLDGDPTNGGPVTNLYSFEMDRMTPEGEYLDCWGRPIRYRENASRGLSAPVYDPDPERARWNIDSFDVWSLGPDPGDPDSVIANADLRRPCRIR